MSLFLRIRQVADSENASSSDKTSKLAAPSRCDGLSLASVMRLNEFEVSGKLRLSLLMWEAGE